METEWQFVADDLAEVRGWLEAEAPAPFRLRAGLAREQRDEYWDTAGWLIWRAGFACRVRRHGEGAELTLKSLAGGEDHLRHRIELNEPLAGGGPPAAVAAPAGEASRLLRTLAGPHTLRPVASLITDRTPIALADGEGALGKIALDRTRVGEGWRAHELLRVEVEVPEVALDRAQPFVAALCEGAGLRPARSGKLTAALAAAGASPGWEPRPLGPMAIDALLDEQGALAEVAYVVLRREFLQMVGHEPVARLGHDIEGVHRMRVASRRLRAAIETFAKALPREVREERRHLRWLARSLGDVRDLDVQRARLAGAGPLIGEDAVAAIDALLAERHALARERMLAALDDPRYLAFTERMPDLLRAGRARRAGEAPARTAAPSSIRRVRARVRREGGRITAASPASDYHALRIHAKRLRYTTEFFAPLYGRPAERYARDVRALQALLGEHQDAVVAAALCERLAQEPAAGKKARSALATLATHETALAESLRGRFPQRFARIRGPRWHAFKAAMAKS